MTPSDFDWAEAHMRATDLYWRLDGLWRSLRPHLLTIDGVDHPAMKHLRQACSELQGVRQALRDEGTKDHERQT